MNLRRKQSYLLLAAGLIFAICAGCGPSKLAENDSVNTSGNADAKATLPADQFLRSVFTRYHNAASYRDHGQVKLEFMNHGRRQTEAAPLSVWYDRGLLYVEAYDVRLRSDTTVFSAWIKDPTNSNHDSQVVRRAPIAQPPTVHELLSDPVLKGKLSAGLGGPPPQLEWLFATEPMKGLFADESNKIRYVDRRTLRGKECTVVAVSATDQIYRFWVETRTSLIHRVELPTILAPTELLGIHRSSSRTQPVRLTLDLLDATFDAPREQPKMEPLPSTPRFVGRFVPLPPREPPTELGQSPSTFRIRDQTGSVTLSNRGSDREVTVVASVNVKPSSLQMADHLAEWASRLPETLGRKVRLALVTDERGFRSLPRDVPAAMFIDEQRSVMSAFNAETDSLVVLDRQGRIAWRQQNFQVQDVQQIGPIVADVLAGVDVPRRLREQWRIQQSAYEATLASEEASQSNRGR